MRRFIKRILYKLAGIKDQLYPVRREHFFDIFFSMVNHRGFFFVQIGACDGKRHDPIYPYVTNYNFAGIAIEPMPHEFKELKNNYRDNSRVQCVNVAIGKETGSFPFYTVIDSYKKDPSSITSVSSFDMETLKKCIIGDLKKRKVYNVNPDKYIKEILVKTLCLNDLVRIYDIKNIDLLQIDCEGYDYEILKTFDFSKFSPKIINFESVHLSERDWQECEKLLKSKGYTFFNSGNDTCAYKL